MKPIFWGATLAVALLALAACGGNVVSTSANAVQVTLTDTALTASQTTFRYGVPYQFTVKNQGSVTHAFLIMPHTQTGESPTQAQQMALGSLSALAPGQTKTLAFTFALSTDPAGKDASTSAQTFALACSTAGHSDATVYLTVIVSTTSLLPSSSLRHKTLLSRAAVSIQASVTNTQAAAILTNVTDGMSHDAVD